MRHIKLSPPLIYIKTCSQAKVDRLEALHRFQKASKFPDPLLQRVLKLLDGRPGSEARPSCSGGMLTVAKSHPSLLSVSISLVTN